MRRPADEPGGQAPDTEEALVAFVSIVETAGKAIDIAGVGVIVLGALLASAVFVRNDCRLPGRIQVTLVREIR
ncbi:hypothetical protein GCM10022226_71270 [Sphaerisporangium flaviroseum]|uniref:Uncharacterized protein n=1 Tax=Sphaerisporangium flaviroseum TaxID=509199 RepID=A0ABP7JA13_9ACTN